MVELYGKFKIWKTINFEHNKGITTFNVQFLRNLIVSKSGIEVRIHS